MSNQESAAAPARPANLLYGLDERPPFGILCLLAFQHIVIMSVSLVLPMVLIAEIGGSFAEERNIVAMSMMACGIGTILQSLNGRFVGSGYLCPNLVGPNFFMVSMEAAWLGGLPLMRGMTIIAGLFEMALARVIHFVRFLFPTEITGLVVLMVGLDVAPMVVSKFLGVQFEGESIHGRTLLTAVLTLLVMMGMNVWGRGKLKLYGVLAGLVSGYLFAFLLELLKRADFAEVMASPWLALPDLRGAWAISFNLSLVPMFLIASVCGALKTFGNLILCEKVNDEQWKKPDMKRIGNGLMADGMCVTASGLLGAMASDTSASNVAFSSASGATSRSIGIATGLLFLLLGFSPKIAAALAVMPTPVMGAVLVYLTSYMIVGGFRIMLSVPMDDRAIFVLGGALIFGLSLEMAPALFVSVPHVLRPLFDSALTLTTLLAVLLNQIFMLGRRLSHSSCA